MWLDFSHVERGPTAIRLVGGIPVFIRQEHAVRNDRNLQSAAHCLMMGGFPVAPVFYHGFVYDHGREFGWGYMSSELTRPMGPFETLDAVLDHFIATLGEEPVLFVPTLLEKLMSAGDPQKKKTDGDAQG